MALGHFLLGSHNFMVVALGHDHGMVRAFDYHPKVVPWVLGYPLCVGTGPQT